MQLLKDIVNAETVHQPDFRAKGLSKRRQSEKDATECQSKKSRQDVVKSEPKKVKSESTSAVVGSARFSGSSEITIEENSLKKRVSDVFKKHFLHDTCLLKFLW